MVGMDVSSPYPSREICFRQPLASIVGGCTDTELPKQHSCKFKVVEFSCAYLVTIQIPSYNGIS